MNIRPISTPYYYLNGRFYIISDHPDAPEAIAANPDLQVVCFKDLEAMDDEKNYDKRNN